MCVSTVFSDICMRAAISRWGMSRTRRRMKASRVLSGMAAIAWASWRNSSRSIAYCSGEAAFSACSSRYRSSKVWIGTMRARRTCRMITERATWNR